MTNEEVIRNVKTAFEWWEDNARMEEDEDWSRQHEALDIAIKALEQQPCKDWRFYYNHGYAQAKRDLLCDDCISREETLKYSHIEYDDDGEGHRVIYTEDIEELPPVQPQRPKGKWIEVELPPYGGFCKCPSCGSEWDFCDNDTERFEYCPRCGMDLREDKE